jgi:hypothetical protein
VPDPHVARQVDHVLVVEDVAREAVVLAQVHATVVAGHYPRRVLSTMLQHLQGIVERLVDRVTADDSHNSAHVASPHPSPAGKQPGRNKLKIWRE